MPESLEPWGGEQRKSSGYRMPSGRRGIDNGLVKADWRNLANLNIPPIFRCIMQPRMVARERECHVAKVGTPIKIGMTETKVELFRLQELIRLRGNRNAFI